METVKKIASNMKYLEDAPTETSNNNGYLTLLNAIDENTTLVGFCEKCNKNGDLTISFGNIKCIMPRAEVSPNIEADGLVHKNYCQSKVGSNLKFNVLRQEGETFIVSRSSYINDVREKYEDILKVGTVLRGKVINIEENIGVFVDVGADYIGLIPKRKLEHIFVYEITDFVTIGENIEAIVLDIDRDEQNNIVNIIMSRVDLLPPYEELLKDYSVGDIVIATVTTITDKSIFTQLDTHLSITCRLSPKVRVQKGQKVRVKLKKIGNSSNSRIGGEIISVI